MMLCKECGKPVWKRQAHVDRLDSFRMDPRTYGRASIMWRSHWRCHFDGLYPRRKPEAA